MGYNANGGLVLAQYVIPNATLTSAGSTANVYNVLLRDGTAFNAGASAATFTSAPSDSTRYLVDCSKFDYIRVTVQASALTGVVGCNLGLFNCFPGSPPTPANGVQPYLTQYFWAPGATNFVTEGTFSPNIAQTTSSGNVAITNAITLGGRLDRIFFAFFATTLPTSGNPLYITVQGY